MSGKITIQHDDDENFTIYVDGEEVGKFHHNGVLENALTNFILFIAKKFGSEVEEVYPEPKGENNDTEKTG